MLFIQTQKFCLAMAVVICLLGATVARAEDMQSISSIKDVMKRRDPFARAQSPYKPIVEVAPVEAPVEAERPMDAIDPNAPDLLRYPFEQYRVLAILLGDVYPRALVSTPERKVFVVREKDKLGNRKGIIRRIQEGAITLVEETRTKSGAIDRVESRLGISGSNGK
jgi:Tfp pilus assembly protein PilP